MKTTKFESCLKRLKARTRVAIFFRVFTCLLIFGSFLTSFVSGSSTDQDSLELKIDKIFEAWNSPDKPGGSVVIVKQGKVIFLKAYGCADLETSAKMTPLTKLYMGSLSKQFTGYCSAKLIISGKLSLDDDIRKYLPEMPSFQKKIQVRDLVFQKSGLRDFLGLLPLTGFHINGYLSNQDALNVLYKQKELNFLTGEKWQYCNTNYFLLGEIVKRVSGISLKQWAKNNVFTPLGMENTLFVDSIETIVPNRARSFYQNRDGSFINDPFLDVTVGHNGLYSTAEDMAKWLIHFQNMIAEADPVFDLMLQNDTLNNGDELSNYSFGLFKSSQIARQYWHRGSFFGFKSIISYYPEKDFGLAIMGNVQSFNRIRYAREITRLFYPELAPVRAAAEAKPFMDEAKKNTKIPIDADLLKRYVGNYIADDLTIYMVRAQKDFLTLNELGGSNKTDLFPIAKHEFRDNESSVLISFSENREGLIEKMTYQTASEKVIGEKAPVLSSSQEEELIGEYFNDELEIYVRIEKTQKGLIAHNLRLGKIELYPSYEDEFKCGHDFFSYISIYRDSGKSVKGFLLDGFFVNNIRFVKVN